MHDVFLALHENAVASGRNDWEMLRALQYRANVVHDALAATQWTHWMRDMRDKGAPKVSSLLSAARHVLLRRKRYHIGKKRSPLSVATNGPTSKEVEPIL